MTRQSMIRTAAAACLAMTAAAGAGTWAPQVRAQTPVNLNTADAVKQALEAQMKKRVKLRLVGGAADVDGVVSQVGSQAVLLTELSGMEFYDATVRLEQIAAVIYRR